MNTHSNPSLNISEDEFNLSPDQLVQWLDAKYSRHKEDEDRQAAQLLRKLIIQVPMDNQRAIVEGAKRQAKRLLKLSKQTPLHITALNEAQEIVARLHGYPTWQAMATFKQDPQEHSHSPKPVLPTDFVTSGIYEDDAAQPGRHQEDVEHSSIGVSNIQPMVHIPIDQNRHLKDLVSWVNETTIPISILTPHFNKLLIIPRSKSAAFFSVEQSMQFNPVFCPLGMNRMLPLHKYRLIDLICSVLDEETKQGVLQQSLSKAIDLAFCENQQNDINHADGYQLAHQYAFTPKTRQAIEANNILKLKDAIQHFIKQGEIDLAMECHAFSMPNISYILSKLKKDELIKSDVKLMHVFQKLSKFWHTRKMGEPWIAPKQTTWVFQVDPLAVDHELPASTRWMTASILQDIRYVSSDFIAEYTQLSTSTYTQETEWLRSIPLEIRDLVVQIHMDATKQSNQAGSVILFDEMDGPLRSSKVCNCVAQILRERRKQGVGALVATRSSKGELLKSMGQNGNFVNGNLVFEFLKDQDRPFNGD